MKRNRKIGHIEKRIINEAIGKIQGTRNFTHISKVVDTVVIMPES